MPAPDEAATRAAYDIVADAYADHFPGTEPEQPVELAMIEHFASLLAAPKRVLDVGCGAGRMLPVLARHGCSPGGVDLSPEMVRRARTDHPEYDVRVGSLTGLDVPDASYDGVFSWYSTIHNPDEDLPAMLAESCRVTRPGGFVLLAFQVGRGVREVGRGFRSVGLDVERLRHHRSPTEMIDAASRQGLEAVAHLERAPVGAEADPQAVLILRRPVDECGLVPVIDHNNYRDGTAHA